MERAAGRARTNHGDTIALTAAPPIPAQPAPLSSVAANSHAGALATAQPKTPRLKHSAAALVTVAMPKARCSAGRLATTTAPITKCAVTAVDTSGNEKFLASRTACR